MSSRPSVPKNIERILWAESGGNCANPDCQIPLIMDNQQTSIADMAHIEPCSQGGGVSANNLILLCKNCHKLHEPVDRPEEKQKLRQWKKDRNRLIQETFAKKFMTFDELSAQVKPLLAENYQIFVDYGPQTDDPEAFKLWQKFEPKLITNNAKLKLMLSNNLALLENSDEYNNQTAIQYFIQHVDEFAETRNGFDGVRQRLFPWRVLSIFGIEAEPYSYEQSINAIQNLIGALQAKGCDVRINFDRNDPRLTIDRGGETETLRLNDNPRVKQLMFSEGAWESHPTDILLNCLRFALEAITRTGAKWSFEEYADLTILTINGHIRVKLFYSYRLSSADLQSTDLRAVKHVANLHKWNGAPSTSEARSYAASIGVKVMTYEEFLLFCRDNAS